MAVAKHVCTAMLLIGGGLWGGTAGPGRAAEVATPRHPLEEAGATLKRDADGEVVEVLFTDKKTADPAIERLADLPRLRSVRLAGTQVTDAGMATLGRIKTLQNLDLRECPITNDGLQHVADLKRLRGLKLAGKEGRQAVDDAGLVHLAGLHELKALACDYLWVSADGLGQLGTCERLEELYLAGTLAEDDALPWISKLPRLKKIRLAKTQVSDAGLALLAKCQALQDLDLSEVASITDDGLEQVGKLVQLTRLNLWRAPVTDAGVAHLAPLVRLQWLNLDNTQLSDAGLISLADMKQLVFLHLGSTQITDAGLRHLEGFANLRDLHVTRTAVTADGVEQLQAKLPKCNIRLRYIAP
jgi:hypothetical protein